MDTLQQIKENPTIYGNTCSIEDLETILKKASHAYYNSEQAILSDIVYDILIDILEERNPKSDILNTVGCNIDDDSKVKLPYYMGSADKIKHKDKIFSWIDKFSNKGQTNQVIISSKLDGISGLYTFQPNSKPKLYTRGNGSYGKDISHLLPYIKMPQLNQSIVVRGEIIISKNNYVGHETEYATIRSMVNGLTNSKTISPLCKLLDFVVFDILNHEITPQKKFELAKSLGFMVPLWKSSEFGDILNWKEDRDNYLFHTLVEYRTHSNYEIDGIIVTHNKIYPNITTGNPKHSVAYKNNSEGKVTSVKEIIWNITKYGVLIPTISFNKINLGSTINKCSGFNGRYIFNNSLGRGAKIRVVLSGEVIPYIVEIITQAPGPDMPSVKYKWDDNRVHCVALELSNENLGKRLTNFIKCIGIDNLSDGLIQRLITSGYNTIDDVLQITPPDLMKIEGFKTTMANKIYNNIHKVIDQPIYLPKIMTGSLLFQHGFSIKRFEKILEKYPDICSQKVSKEMIISIPGFQEKTASQFIDNLENFKTFLEEHNYLQYYVANKKSVETQQQKMTNMNVVITGGKPLEIIQFIESNGGKIQASLNSKTHLLIIKDESIKNNKTEGAKKLNIEIVTIEQFKTNYDV